jgi:hypothetical protein
MNTTLRIVSLLLVCGMAAACSGDGITGPGRTPGDAHHDGLGYLGGGGRSSASVPTTALARP